MDVKIAAKNTLTLWSKTDHFPKIAARADNGHGREHQRFVLEEVAQGNITGEKAHRWLSWAQGYLACLGDLTLENCKHANVLS